MTREAAVLVMVAVAAALLGLVAWGWARRVRRDRALSAPIGELAMLDALPDHHELTLGRVSASDRQFGLDRPPRA